MKQLAKWLAMGYLLFAPWTTWLAVTGWLRVPVMFLLATMVPALAYLISDLIKRPAKIFAMEEDWLLVILSGLAVTSFLKGPQMDRSLNHTLSFLFAYLVYAIYARWMLARMGVSIRQIFALAMWAVVICDVIVVIEWFTVNFTDILIRRWFVLDPSVTNMEYYYQLFFNSVAGVCEEPSLMSMNLNCLFPLGWYYLQQTRPRWQAQAYVALTLLAQVFIVSSGGVGLLLIGYIWGNFATIDWRRVGRVAMTLGGAAAVALIVYLVVPFTTQRLIEEFFAHVVKKMTFNSASSSMRVEAWRWAIDDWLTSPWLGTYPGFGNINHNHFGYQGGYFKILAETGIISLVLFLTWLAVIYFRVIQVNKELRPYLVMAFVAGFGHLIIADGYYHISIWVPVLVAQLIALEVKERKRAVA